MAGPLRIRHESKSLDKLLTMTVTTCAQCQTVLNETPQTPSENREPCPNCGSMERLYQVLIEGKVEVRSSLGIKARHGNIKKPFLEQKSGDNFSQKVQKWVYRLMRVDRDNDNYSEIVVDLDTNDVLHKSDEPLSRHQGHGSAKSKKNI